MREKICCFLDNDEQYVIMLTEYINSHHALMYRAMAFTSGQALLEAMDGYDIELMVIADDLAGEPFMENVKYKSLIILSDNADNGCVDRYQPADDIIRDLIAHMSGYETIPRRETDKTVMVSIYSPATKCFKTTSAIAAALVCGRKGHTLFVSLEQFSGLGNIFRNDRGGLSEAIYNYRAGGNNAYGKILSCTSSMPGFDYLAPVNCADDIADTDDSEITKMFAMLSEKGNYKYIVADVGCVFNKPWKLLENSDVILVPEPLDYMGGRKLADFEKYLMMSGRNGVADRLVKVKMPYIDSIAGYEISMENASIDEIQKTIGRCLDGQSADTY